MEALVDWVLKIFGIQVMKKRSVRSVFSDYLSVSYEYDGKNIFAQTLFLI